MLDLQYLPQLGKSPSPKLFALKMVLCSLLVPKIEHENKVARHSHHDNTHRDCAVLPGRTRRAVFRKRVSLTIFAVSRSQMAQL